MDLNLGTKELISVDVTDRLENITDLSSSVVDYRVANDDGSDKIPWTSATAINLMRVDCLIDTSGWSKSHYELYIRPTIGSEAPILGPFDFNLI